MEVWSRGAGWYRGRDSSEDVVLDQDITVELTQSIFSLLINNLRFAHLFAAFQLQLDNIDNIVFGL